MNHHLPIFGFLVIGLPFVMSWAAVEPAVGLAAKFQHLEPLFETIEGWGFLSSFNEFLMCNQQAENYLRARVGWAPRVFSSPFGVGLELSFKLAVFTVFPFLSFLGGLRYDGTFWSDERAARGAAGSPAADLLAALSSAAAMVRSPLWLRCCAWRVFILTKYPFMAKRGFSRLKRFWTGGDPKSP